MSGPMSPTNRPMSTTDNLLPAAEGGDLDAQFALPRLLDYQNPHEEALVWLRRGAEGSGDATLMLGLRLFTGPAGAAPSRQEGAAFIAQAARRGKAEAYRFLSSSFAHGRVRPQSWKMPSTCSSAGQFWATRPAADQLAFLTAEPEAKAAAARGEATQETWAKARAGIDLQAHLRAVPVKDLSALASHPNLRRLPHPCNKCARLIDTQARARNHPGADLRHV